MDNQTAKSIDRSLKSIAESLKKMEKNTRSTVKVPEEPLGLDFRLHESVDVDGVVETIGKWTGEIGIAQIGKGPRFIPRGTAYHFDGSE